MSNWRVNLPKLAEPERKLARDMFLAGSKTQDVAEHETRRGVSNFGAAMLGRRYCPVCREHVPAARFDRDMCADCQRINGYGEA